MPRKSASSAARKLGGGERRKLLESIGLLPAYEAYQRERQKARQAAGQSTSGTLKGAKTRGGSGTGGEANGGAVKDANTLFDPLLLKIKGGMVPVTGGPLTVDAAVPMEPGKEAETVRWVGDNMAVTSPDLSTAPSTTALWLLSVARESPVDFLRLWTELLKFQRKAEAAVKFAGDDGRVLGLMSTLLGNAAEKPHVKQTQELFEEAGG